MTILITCPDCSTEYNVAEAHAGKRTKCKNCGALIEIPQPSEQQQGGPDAKADAESASPAQGGAKVTRGSARTGTRAGRGEKRGASSGGVSRRSRDAEPLEDALPGMAVAASLAAAVAGALAWVLVLWKADMEIGWLAIGVGAFAGFAMVKFGGRGVVAAVVAAVLGGIGVLGGHVAGVKLVYEQAIEEEVYSRAAQEDYKEQRSYGREIAKMDHPLSTETVAAYAKEFGMEDPMSPSEIAAFKAQMEDWELLARKGGAQLYQDRQRAALREEIGLFDFLKETFEPIDLLFLALGIGAAFSLVRKES